MTGPNEPFAAEREELNRILDRMAAANAQLQEMTRNQVEDLRRQRAEWAAEDDARAEQARRGDLGPEWRRLQQRIDLNQTSISDIVAGRDGSPEAETVLRRAQEKAAELYAEQVSDLEDDQPSELGSEIAATRAEVARLREVVEQAVQLGNRPYGSIGLAEVSASAPLNEG